MKRRHRLNVAYLLGAFFALLLGSIPLAASAGTLSWNKTLPSAENILSLSNDGSVMLAGENGGYFYLSTTTGSTWTKQTGLGTDGWSAGFVSSDGSRIVAVSSSNEGFGGKAGNGGSGGLSTDSTNAGGTGGSVMSLTTAHNGLPGTGGGGGGGGSGGGGATDGGGGGGGAGGEVIVTEVFSGPATTTLYYMASSTWHKPENLDHIIVQVWGGGGGGPGGGGGHGAGGNGAASSFTYNSGANTITANGGSGSGSGGTATGGDTNTTGSSGNSTGGANGVSSAVGIPGSGQGGTGGQGGKTGGEPPGGTGPGAGGGGGSNNGANGSGGGGGGGYAEKTLTASQLGSTETILVGGGGGGGGGNLTGGGGGNGSSSTGSAGVDGTSFSGGGGGGGGFAGAGGIGIDNSNTSSLNNDTYVSTNEGVSWSVATSSEIHSWTSLSAATDTMTMLGINGTDGYLYFSTDGGVNFSPLATSTISVPTLAFVTPDGNELIAYDGDDTIYTSTDQGVVWTAHTGQSAYDWSVLTSSSDGSVLYGIDSGDTVYVSTSTANSWTALSNAASSDSIKASSDGTVVFASKKGSDLDISEDSGSTWATQSSLGGKQWNALALSGNGEKFLANESNVWLGKELAAAPTFSSINASTSDSVATITWTTNTAASTKVAYSSDASYAFETAETNLSPGVTSHSVSLSGLPSCTDFNYEVVSGGASITYATSSSATFMTSGCPGDATPSATTTASITVSNTATSTISDGGNSLTVVTPANFTATSSTVIIQIKGLSATPVLDSIGKPSSSLSSAASIVFDVTALVNNTTVLDSFDHPVTITYQYTDADVSGLDESSLKMYHYHDGAWLPLDNCSVDTTANTITCTTPSFSTFAIFGSSATTAAAASTSSAGNALPWCSGPSAPGWNTSLPDGGCGASTGSVASSATPSNLANCDFTRDLDRGMSGADVLCLQQYLNANGAALADKGPGSPGQETDYFGTLTFKALVAFQNAHAAQILAPLKLSSGTGYFGASTRTFVDEDQ